MIECNFYVRGVRSLTEVGKSELRVSSDRETDRLRSTGIEYGHVVPMQDNHVRVAKSTRGVAS